MTEEEWDGNQRAPLSLFRYSAREFSARKLQLLALGLCRLMPLVLEREWSLRALEAADDFVDEKYPTGNYAKVIDELNRLLEQIERAHEPDEPDHPDILRARVIRAACATSNLYQSIPTLIHSVRFHLLASLRPTSKICHLIREMVSFPLGAYRRSMVPGPYPQIGFYGPRTGFFYPSTEIINIATGIDQCRGFDRLPILADALEDSGFADEKILAHFRNGKEHLRGCWALDLILGKS